MDIKMPAQNITANATEALAQMVKLRLDLIPIRIGDKVPAKARWNVPVKRHLATVIHEFTRSYDALPNDLTIEQFVARYGNIGVLNESSQIVTLDCDSPLAGAALKAACEALGGDYATLYPETSWTSVKGQKAMYRRPIKMQAGRTVFRVWKGDGTYDVIFELRGTGQDVLPPSYRADAGVRLAWFHETPTKIVQLPKWIERLNAELLVGRGPAIDAMCEALKLTPEQRSRTNATTHSMQGYPPGLAGFASEQAYVNANYQVEQLLEAYGYTQVGKRWKPAGSSHAAGIVPPRNDKENWICEHESDPLAGVFDAWRIIVEHEFAGNPAAAAESVRIEQRRGLAKQKPDPSINHSVSNNPQQSSDQPVPPAHSVTRQPVGQRDDQKDDPQGHNSEVVGVLVGQVSVDIETLEKDAEQPATGTTEDHGDPGPAVRAEHASNDEQDKGRRKPKGRGLHDNFLSEKTESIVPIVSGYLQLPPGMHLLSAMPKAGKSTLITAMSLVAGTGATLSGLVVAKPVEVLYCAFDENIKQNLQPRIQRLFKVKDLSPKLIRDNLTIFSHPDELIDWARACKIDTLEPLPFEWTPDDTMTDEEVDARAALLRSRFNPYTRALFHYLRVNRVRFCCIDVISKMRVRAQHGQSAYDRDLEEYSAVNAIGIETSCAIVGVHHMNKDSAGRLSEAGTHSLAKVSGTNAIAGAVQSIISMSRISGKDVDQEALHDIEPKGAKIIIDQIARDTRGLNASAFSLVATPVEGFDTPALEWVYMGPADVLMGTDDREFVLEWLFDQPAQDYMPADAIFQAAVQAGVTSSRSKDSFRKTLQRMRTRSQLDSLRGPSGGFRLSPQSRLMIDARRNAKPY
jgi:hypothetical protein